MSNVTTYWGVLCRTCAEPIAFDARPYNESGLGSANIKPGAIRCFLGHHHIYFPRDFQFFTSAALITVATMQDNRAAYQAANPPSSPPSRTTSDLDPALWSGVRSVQEESRSKRLGPDPRREAAQMAAKARWADWARKKVL
jgi:hypothetical protein